METSDKIITDLVLKGFKVIEELLPSNDLSVILRINIIKDVNKRYFMAEKISLLNFTMGKYCCIPFIRRNILEQLLNELKKNGEI
jgi:hypothetical protein